MAEIDRDLWRETAIRRDGCRSQALTGFETDYGRNGIDAAVRFLTDLGLAVVVDEVGPHPRDRARPTNPTTTTGVTTSC